MTPEDKDLGKRLLTIALDNTDHPASAVSILVSAAVTILERNFGGPESIDLLTQALDTAGAQLRRELAN